jgi:beta-glucosidase
MKWLAWSAAVAACLVTIWFAARTPSPRAPVEVAPVPERARLDWLDKSRGPDERAALLVAAMTLEEKLTVVSSYFGVQEEWNHYRFPEARPQSAGLVRGVPRLRFPPQWQTDAGSGVGTQGQPPANLERTQLPSGLLTAATWNPALAERAGAMIGDEARRSGFNVMLAGGVNLLRDPGNGRNFEYAGEDPLLAGRMVGAFVRGVQANRIVSTIKHFAFNDQETGRGQFDVVVDEATARLSDLLAFQIALEQGDPGAVMCSYNRVNGDYACENDWLLNQVLKRDWGFPGYVLSDWGAQHETVANANHGLDQEAGIMREGEYQWLDKLRAAIARGAVPAARLDDMVRRIARTLIAKGAIDDPVAPAPIDFAAHARVAQADAEEGMVLLKNAGLLPLPESIRTLAIIGGHADVGVLSGGGSSQVYPPGGNAVPGLSPPRGGGRPLVALQAERPRATIAWADGKDVAVAAHAAAGADLALVFATQWTAESLDFPLTLPEGQDALIEAVARANPRTVVVLETGGPVLMPWIERVGAVLEAWYPGSQGGPAIARVLTGAVNPSGHLPATFPRSTDQLPRPAILGAGAGKEERFPVHFVEGAAVGYRWFERRGHRPLFPFGHGLSYTTFVHDQLAVRIRQGVIEATFRIRNTGRRRGQDVAMLFVSSARDAWEAPRRLAAFAKEDLSPGESRVVTVTVDPRLLAIWDTPTHGFRVLAGDYRFALAADALVPGSAATLSVPARTLPAGGGVR